MIILKFGGKSLGDKQKIDKIADYIKERSKEDKLVVVVSAMADTTDRLIDMANHYCQKTDSRELDALLSCGEAVSSSLISMKLNSLDVKSVSLLGWQAGIYAEGEYNNCIITGIDKSFIEEKLKNFDCVVVAGFQAINKNGDIVTLGRGGSDTTAVALGSAFKCKVEIYSDFDGIFAGDPREDDYKKYQTLDYLSVCDYAQTGAKVLNKHSTQVALQSQVDLICKSSQEPYKSGTVITSVPSPFVAINVIKNLCEIKLISNNYNMQIEKTVKYILKNVKFHKISIKKDKLTLLVDQKDLKKVEHNIAKINDLLNKKRD